MTPISASRPCLIGLPYDASSSYLRGPAQAPPLIREALRSWSSNSWTEDLQDIDGPGGLLDVGDLELPEDGAAREMIREGIAAVLNDGRRPIALGGDHSVTYPVLQAVHERHPGLSILHLDAHPDLYQELEGDTYSHACPFARIMEDGLASRLVQVGIRTLNRHQQEQADRFGVEVIDMQAWTEGVRTRFDGPLYLSVDLDVLDPAFAPGISHREPGGLSVREVIGLIQSLEGNLVGADVVEYNPVQDTGDMTARVAAKFVKEIAGKMMRDELSATTNT